MRDGLMPTLVGSAVMASGAVMRGIDMRKRGMHKKDIMPLVGAGLLGFGLAHVVWGTQEMVKKSR